MAVPKALQDLTKPKTYPSSFAKQEVVKVAVGKKRRLFNVYKDVLCSKSPYFAARLRECWKQEGAEINIEDATPEDFKVVIDWLYTGAIPGYFVQTSDAATGPNRVRYLYKLADRLLLVDLQNALVDVWIGLNITNDQAGSLFSVRDMIEEGLAHTPLYRLVLKDAAKGLLKAKMDDDAIEEEVDALAAHPDAMREVLILVGKYYRRPWSYVSAAEAKEYYVKDHGGANSPA